jgi:hypothetical protein
MEGSRKIENVGTWADKKLEAVNEIAYLGGEIRKQWVNVKGTEKT